MPLSVAINSTSRTCMAMLSAGIWIGFFITGTKAHAQEQFAKQREVMVESQLLGRDIRDKATLRAMRKVERHSFVPENVRELAYYDNPLPIGYGQTISQPYIVAYMTQLIKPRPEYRVLEVGTGSGYQAAVLAEIVDSVFTIEIVEELGNLAKKKLKKTGYHNVSVRIGDGYHGWEEKAPFDAILVTAGAETIPQALLQQLKDGGRMVIPVGPHRGIRQLTLVQRKGDKFKKSEVMATRFVPFTRQKD